MKPKVSVVIPSRNERFLQPTIQTLLDTSSGPIEILPVCDGYIPPPEEIVDDGRVRYIYQDAKGMRASINTGVACSLGEYILKADGHCIFAEGWDDMLVEDCDEDWVVVPRRKRLDGANWCVQENDKPDISYHYLGYPNRHDDFGGPGLHAIPWHHLNANKELESVLIDDLMTFQGSSWFMPRAHFDRMDLMEDERYGSFLNEPQEIGFKTWLSGGRVVVNKKLWYAHLHKGKLYGRGYFMDEKMLKFGQQATKKWLTNEAWDKTIYPFQWLIEKFWPVPRWPEDRELWMYVPGYNID